MDSYPEECSFFSTTYFSDRQISFSEAPGIMKWRIEMLGSDLCCRIWAITLIVEGMTHALAKIVLFACPPDYDDVTNRIVHRNSGPKNLCSRGRSQPFETLPLP